MQSAGASTYGSATNIGSIGTQTTTNFVHYHYGDTSQSWYWQVSGMAAADVSDDTDDTDDTSKTLYAWTYTSTDGTKNTLCTKIEQPTTESDLYTLSGTQIVGKTHIISVATDYSYINVGDIEPDDGVDYVRNSSLDVNSNNSSGSHEDPSRADFS